MLTRFLPAIASSIDKEKRQITDVPFSSTAPVERFAWDLPLESQTLEEQEDQEEEIGFLFKEVLSHNPTHWRTDRVTQGVCPYLKNHDRSKKIGKVLTVQFRGEQAYFTAQLGRSADAEQLLMDIEDGIAGGVSFGYRVHKYRVLSPAEYEGKGWHRRLVKMAVLEGIDIELFEISDEPMPADPSVGYGKSSQEKVSLRSLSIEGDPGWQSADVPKVRSDMDQEKQPDIRAEMDALKREFTTVQQENLRLSQALETREKEVAALSLRSLVTTKYTSLRQRAEQLRNDGKLPAVEFDEEFTANSSQDIEGMLNQPPEEINARLMQLDFWLSKAAKRSPLLNLEQKTGYEPLLPRTSDEKSERIEDFLKTFKPRKLY